MIREIQARTLLQTVRGDDRVFGLKYNLNLYRGCAHQCIYCDSRSACYQIENFNDTLVKVNALELLERELRSKRLIGTIGFGSMSDPYAPVERIYNLSGQALEIIARHGFPVHLITKSDLVVKDLPALLEISRVQCTVGFSLSTAEDALARQVEPGAPLPSARLAAMRALSAAGVAAGTIMMPILPFLEDTPENIRAIVEQTAAHGGKFIIPWLGMSMRDRQREHFYAELDRRFPGLRARYEKTYGEAYSCPAPNARALDQVLKDACRQAGLALQLPYFTPRPRVSQLSLFG